MIIRFVLIIINVRRKNFLQRIFTLLAKVVGSSIIISDERKIYLCVPELPLRVVAIGSLRVLF